MTCLSLSPPGPWWAGEGEVGGVQLFLYLLDPQGGFTQNDALEMSGEHIWAGPMSCWSGEGRLGLSSLGRPVC